MKKALKLLLLAGMICFFFPFAMVSCSGESVEVSGAELMTTISMHEDIEFDEDDSPNIYLCVAFGLGLAGIAFAWNTAERDKRTLAAAGCSFGGAVFLILFRTTFWDVYELTGYEGRITVEFRWGWILSLILYIAAGACALLTYYLELPSQQYGYGRDTTVIPDAPPPNPVMGGGAISDQKPPKPSEPDKTPEIDEAPWEPPCLPPPNVKLHVHQGDGETTIDVDTFPFTIGRDSELVELPLIDPKASRVHLQIILDGNSVIVMDLDSSNGTRVNGELISEPTEVLSGDEVLIGSTRITFEISE